MNHCFSKPTLPTLFYNCHFISTPVIIMKEDSEICAFVIIVFKMASRSPKFGGKKRHPLFFTKSWSKNNFKPKNQFQQANPTGAQNLTLCPLLISEYLKTVTKLTSRQGDTYISSYNSNTQCTGTLINLPW